MGRSGLLYHRLVALTYGVHIVDGIPAMLYGGCEDNLLGRVALWWCLHSGFFEIPTLSKTTSCIPLHKSACTFIWRCTSFSNTVTCKCEIFSNLATKMYKLLVFSWWLTLHNVIFISNNKGKYTYKYVWINTKWTISTPVTSIYMAQCINGSKGPSTFFRSFQETNIVLLFLDTPPPKRQHLIYFWYIDFMHASIV